jgi:hypothetical protein
MTAPVAPPPPTPPRAPIDPRILQRRVQVRRDEGRRRLHLLIAVAGVAALVVAAWGVTRSPLMSLDRVQVRGAVHTTPAQVVAAAGLHHGQAMTDLREGGIAHRVDRLPWISHTHVVRRWPGTVVITISERAPRLTVAKAGHGWQVLDRSGRVLETTLVPLPGLPRIEGLSTRAAPGQVIEPTLRPALAVAVAIPVDRLGRLPAVLPRPDGSVSVSIWPTGTIDLGPPVQVGEKLKSAFLVLDHLATTKTDPRTIKMIDVRVPGSPTLTLNTAQA